MTYVETLLTGLALSAIIPTILVTAVLIGEWCFQFKLIENGKLLYAWGWMTLSVLAAAWTWWLILSLVNA